MSNNLGNCTCYAMATLGGTVTDALTKAVISDVSVTAENQSSFVDTSASTNGSGVYGMTIAAGTYSVSATKTGYSNYSFFPLVIGVGDSKEHSFSMAPTEAGIRMVVNWGALPLDLDAHLKTPLIGGTAYHVRYNARGSNSAAPYAKLDADVTEGNGPETITIYTPYNTGNYRFFVHNYKEEDGNTGELTVSGAVAQIYVNSTLVKTYIVPTTGTGDYWNICTIAYDGTTVTVGDVNTIVSSEPS